MNVNPAWTKVDRYIEEKLIPSDPVLEETIGANRKAGLPAIDVTHAQGKLLHLLARMQDASRILEIGTLGGYSTIWLARALPPGGKLVTLELDPHHAATAANNISRAGLAALVDIRLGNALDQLERLGNEQAEPFDLVFIDADKPNNPAYLRWALRLARPGAVIIGDNVIRDGEVVNETSPDPRVQGVRKFFDLLAGNPAIDATAIQTVGAKGYDGFAIGIVR
ncbi:O-methyltransferase [Paenibacillus ginsengarvi]|uniref:O-methyltransferase n=1 Tax=Paenibacillus ginsengarvi TaxID=400777 RepID=A0A3B0CIP9_9BACL|nr:O-methyltransferase [Paenibacillus ginsengarvi]RKN85072.1 O-methyltransferase [Paenibacillus ginsengarvi]